MAAPPAPQNRSSSLILILVGRLSEGAYVITTSGVMVSCVVTTGGVKVSDTNEERTLRRFQAGQTFEIGGVQLRVVPGYKRPKSGGGQDLRLDILTPWGWRPVHMALGAVMTGFFYENEDVLYPPPKFLGGEKYMAYLRKAVEEGWEVAEAELKGEKGRAA